MEEFEDLMGIIERLLAPDGCPWDREQTLASMRSSLLEETSEVIEAIDWNDPVKIEEELGDLFFNVVFLCQLAEKEHSFTMRDVLRHICAKLIRRHPHIFGQAQVKNSEEVLKQWEEIKQHERGTDHPRGLLEGIPKDLPPLMRAHKIIKRLKKSGYAIEQFSQPGSMDDEVSLGALLFQLVAQSQERGLDAEQALRRFLANLTETIY